MAYDLERYTGDAIEVVVNSMMVHIRHIMTPALEERIRNEFITRERFLWLIFGATHSLGKSFNFPEPEAFISTVQVFNKLNGGDYGTALTDASRIRQQLLEDKPITKAMANAGMQSMQDYFTGEDVYAFTKAVKMLETLK